MATPAFGGVAGQVARVQKNILAALNVLEHEHPAKARRFSQPANIRPGRDAACIFGIVPPGQLKALAGKARGLQAAKGTLVACFIAVEGGLFHHYASKTFFKIAGPPGLVGPDVGVILVVIESEAVPAGVITVNNSLFKRLPPICRRYQLSQRRSAR